MVDVPANSTTTATFETDVVGNIGSYSGRLESVGDHDWLRITLEAGFNYRFFLSLQQTALSIGDSTLTIRDANGLVVAFDQAGGAGANSFLIYSPPATGTYFVDIGEPNDDARGAYSILFDRTFFGQTPAFLTESAESAQAGANEELGGGAGNDTIGLAANGGFGALGEQGDDTLFGSNGFNILAGGLGNDFATGLGGDDVIFGDAGDDTLLGNEEIDQLFGGDGFDNLDGGDGNDFLNGGADDDDLRGGDGDDNLKGGSGDDIVFGDNGGDALIGGTGRDILSGGAGLDSFVFNSKGETGKTATTRDVIMDFVHSDDHIDLSLIDAKSGAGNQSFKFIGAQKFHHKAGELKAKYNAALDAVVVTGDINGDGKADFQIEVHGVAALVKGDFIL